MAQPDDRLHECLRRAGQHPNKVITHSPRAITITAIAWVILTLHKRKLVKNLGAESAVRLARLVWL